MGWESAWNLVIIIIIVITLWSLQIARSEVFLGRQCFGNKIIAIRLLSATGTILWSSGYSVSNFAEMVTIHPTSPVQPR